MQNATQRRRLVLDMDVGVDDALAILYLAARPGVEIVAVGAVHGNCRGEASAQNALRTLELCGLGRVPVALGATQPLFRELELTPHVHGEDGLGNVRLPMPNGRPTDEHAADQIVRLANEHPGELELLATGPLTNLGLALQKDPEVLTRFKQVVLMGGSGPYPAPGTILERDMNVAFDPHAADMVFAAPRGLLVMVGANVTTPTLLDENDLARINRADTIQARFASRILDYYVDFYAQKWGRRLSSMHDPLAAGIAVDPTYATAYVDGPVKVMPDNLLHRAILMEDVSSILISPEVLQRPPTRVVTAVDDRRYLDDFVAALVEPLPAWSAAS